MFTGFQVNLFVADVERAVAFYVAIGAEETFRTPAEGSPDHVEVRIGGATVGLASVAAAREHHGLDVAADGAGAELVLWTDDLTAAWSLLKAAGARPMAPPETVSSGLRVAWAADPDGNPVHLVQRVHLTGRAVAVVRRDDAVLVMRRHRSGAEVEDYTVLPGGGVEEGETFEEAAVRELAEEASLGARVERQLLAGHHGPREARYFLMTDVEGDAVLGGEEAQAHSPDNSFVLAWVPVTALAEEPLFPEHLRRDLPEALS